jgi:hypothetical protein
MSRPGLKMQNATVLLTGVTGFVGSTLFPYDATDILESLLQSAYAHL